MIEVKPIEIDLHWLDVFNLINGIGGWKQRYGLDIKYYASMNDDTQEWGSGGVIWRGPNYKVILLSTREETSIIDFQIDNNKPASGEVQKTWVMLDSLFRRHVVSQSVKGDIKEIQKHFIKQYLEKDYIAKQVFELTQDDPTLTDLQIAQKISIGRDKVNLRRRILEDLGCKVRESKAKKKKMSRQNI